VSWGSFLGLGGIKHISLETSGRSTMGVNQVISKHTQEQTTFRLTQKMMAIKISKEPISTPAKQLLSQHFDHQVSRRQIVQRIFHTEENRFSHSPCQRRQSKACGNGQSNLVQPQMTSLLQPHFLPSISGTVGKGKQVSAFV
jgi:hypothetical protein